MTAPLLDLGSALEFLDGDEDLCEQMLQVLQPVLANAVTSLPDLVARRNWRETRAIAHKLAPSLSIFSPVVAKPMLALASPPQHSSGESPEAGAAQAVQLLVRLLREVEQEVASRTQE